jgi:hypothetical protein
MVKLTDLMETLDNDFIVIKSNRDEYVYFGGTVKDLPNSLIKKAQNMWLYSHVTNTNVVMTSVNGRREQTLSLEIDY